MAATFDYLHKNKKDSSIVIYFHGGFIPIQNAYRQPLTKGFDTAFRNGAHFPYYVLYGNGAGNTIWVYLRNKFFNHEDGNEEFMETGNPTFEDSLEQLFKKQSFIYIIGQTNRKFSSNDGIQSKDYIPYDTTNLEETVLAELNKESFTGTLDKSYLNDSTADKLFEKQLYSDKKLQNLAKADYLEE